MNLKWAKHRKMNVFRFFLQKTVLLGRYTQFISFENVTKSAPKITDSKIAKKELKHP